MTTYQPGDRVTIAETWGPDAHGTVTNTPGILPGRVPVRRDGDPHTITLVKPENLTPEIPA